LVSSREKSAISLVGKGSHQCPGNQRKKEKIVIVRSGVNHGVKHAGREIRQEGAGTPLGADEKNGRRASKGGKEKGKARKKEAVGDRRNTAWKRKT